MLKKYKLINLIHPSVSIPKDVKIGSGNIIFQMFIKLRGKNKRSLYDFFWE